MFARERPAVQGAPTGALPAMCRLRLVEMAHVVSSGRIEQVRELRLIRRQRRQVQLALKLTSKLVDHIYQLRARGNAADRVWRRRIQKALP